MFDFLKKWFPRITPRPSLGAEVNPVDHRDIMLGAFQLPVSLPAEYFTDISMIPVQDQKQIGSCVGQAEGTILSYFDWLENANSDISRRFIYTQSKLVDGLSSQGTYPRVAAGVVYGKGAPKSALLADNNDLVYSEYLNAPTTPEILADAKKRKATYATTGVDGTSLKQALVQNKLVSITILVDWEAWRTSNLTKPNAKNIAGGHRIVLYGFRGDTFFARNSWSSNWGDKGNLTFNIQDYNGFVLDPICYTDVPNEILKKAQDEQYIFTKPMKIGMTDFQVQKLQERLNVNPRTGYFGPITKAAVIKFQQTHALVADGVVGKATLDALNGIKVVTIKDTITKIANELGVEPELAIAVAKAESSLNPNCINKNKGGSIDRGLFQWNDYYHPEITDAMAFNPEIATRLFCKAVKGGSLHAYWSASEPNWKKLVSTDILKKYKIAL